MYFKIFVYVFRDFYMEKQPNISPVINSNGQGTIDNIYPSGSMAIGNKKPLMTF